jgi:hypothetical protein
MKIVYANNKYEVLPDPIEALDNEEKLLDEEIGEEKLEDSVYNLNKHNLKPHKLPNIREIADPELLRHRYVMYESPEDKAKREAELDRLKDLETVRPPKMANKNLLLTIDKFYKLALSR